jgi:hypothetical protein
MIRNSALPENRGCVLAGGASQGSAAAARLLKKISPADRLPEITSAARRTVELFPHPDYSEAFWRQPGLFMRRQQSQGARARPPEDI